MSHGLDYAPVVVRGARVQWTDRFKGEQIGHVLCVLDSCHWGCRESDERWRPRAAYVLEDTARPGRDGVILGRYVPPERLEVVPGNWAAPFGVRRFAQMSALSLRAAVVRFGPGGTAWLLSRADRGWGESGYCHVNLGELCAVWGALPVPAESRNVVRTRDDSHGRYLQVAAKPTVVA